MLDIKEIKAVVQQISETRQLPEDSLWGVIETAFAAAYKKEYAKSDQIIRTRINQDTGEFNFFQVKQVLSEEDILPEDEVVDKDNEEDKRVRFNPERHMMVNDAQLVRQGVKSGEEIEFPLEVKTDFSRIASQSARQAVTQKIHEAEREAAISEFKGKERTIVHGKIQRIERGNVFVDLGRTVAILPFSEQIKGERFKQGDTIRAYLQTIDMSRRSGGFVKLSRASEEFVVKLFEAEVPELLEGVLEIKEVARDPGVRTKLAVESKDMSVDPVGSLVGQRGVRVMAVKSELGGEQIDIVNWSDNISEFIDEALLPAEVFEVVINEDEKRALVKTEDGQIPIAIGRGGQNIKLAAKLTGWTIVVVDSEGAEVAEADREGNIKILKQEEPGEREERMSREEKRDEEENESEEGGEEVKNESEEAKEESVVSEDAGQEEAEKEETKEPEPEKEEVKEAESENDVKEPEPEKDQ